MSSFDFLAFVFKKIAKARFFSLFKIQNHYQRCSLRFDFVKFLNKPDRFALLLPSFGIIQFVFASLMQFFEAAFLATQQRKPSPAG